MAAWVVRGGSGGRREQRMIDNSFVSIGWIDLPELFDIKTKDQLEKLYMEVCADAKKR